MTATADDGAEPPSLDCASMPRTHPDQLNWAAEAVQITPVYRNVEVEPTQLHLWIAILEWKDESECLHSHNLFIFQVAQRLTQMSTLPQRHTFCIICN